MLHATKYSPSYRIPHPQSNSYLLRSRADAQRHRVELSARIRYTVLSARTPDRPPELAAQRQAAHCAALIQKHISHRCRGRRGCGRRHGRRRRRRRGRTHTRTHGERVHSKLLSGIRSHVHARDQHHLKYLNEKSNRPFARAPRGVTQRAADWYNRIFAHSLRAPRTQAGGRLALRARYNACRIHTVHKYSIIC